MSSRKVGRTCSAARTRLAFCAGGRSRRGGLYKGGEKQLPEDGTCVCCCCVSGSAEVDAVKDVSGGSDKNEHYEEHDEKEAERPV